MELGSHFDGLGMNLFRLFRVVHTYCYLPAEIGGSRWDVLLGWSNISDVSRTCSFCVTVRWCVATRGDWFLTCFVLLCLLQVSLQLLWMLWAAWSLVIDEGCFTGIVSSVNVWSSLFVRGVGTVRPIIQCSATLVQGCSSRAVFRETLDCEWLWLTQ